MSDPLRIVSLIPLSPTDRDAITATAGVAELTMVDGWFDGELRTSWGDYVADSYLRPGSIGERTRAERDSVLATADVVLGGFPMPVDLVGRASQLKWVHQTPAGASNLRKCDLWGSDVTVTTSRGLGNTLAIAEYVVAAFAHFARGLHRAHLDAAGGTFDRFAYRPIQLAGKRVCVVGAGGIGQDVGRLCAALGMDVVGTRRTVGESLPEGFNRVGPPSELHELLDDATFVAVCCQWTPETQDLLGASAFAAMPDGAVVVNVARGEIVDEQALVANVDRLRGVALDVYVGEFERTPPAELWNHPNVMITPHISAGSDSRSRRPIDLFRDNLEALLAGRPLSNVIDWSLGY